jgi:RimJ/RimL family protein N-acetyltransferase
VLRPPSSPLGDGVVTLRLLAASDRAAVLETMRDPLVRRWLNMPLHPRDGDVDELLRTAERGQAQGTRFDLVVVEGESPPLGEVVLSQRHRDNWEVAYMAPERGRGRGLMARAVRVACDWLLGQGVGRIELRTHPENAASQRLAERAGFTREGLERRSIWLHGSRQDALVWSLLPGDRG